MKIPARFSAVFLLAGVSAWGDVVLNEIVSQNTHDGFAAANGSTYDWIELFNDGPEEVDLLGSYLTDDQSNLTKWRFERSFLIPAGGFSIVFASDLDDLIEAQEHLNFKLNSGDGEYLALVSDDGETIADDFNPAFPSLRANHSFGIPADGGDRAILMTPTPGKINSVAAPLPAINVFEASETVIANGESITISWQTINSESLTLKTSSSQNSVVSSEGSVILRPTQHEIITLTARNGYAAVSRTIEILVGPTVTDFTTTPGIIANGGETVLRWATIGTDRVIKLNQFPINNISSPIEFTPTNLNLIPLDAIWKVAPDHPRENWQAVDYDDSEWIDIVPPFEGSHHYRKTFRVSDPESLAVGVIQVSHTYNLQLSLNGQTIFNSGIPNGTPRAFNGIIRFSPSLLREGENVLAASLSSQFGEYDIKLDAWRSQPIDTIVPITLLTQNEVGEESRTVDITVLAEDTPLPSLPTIAISEFFWGYNGTFPVEPYRFFEFQNYGDQAVDLSDIQFIGDSHFKFSDGLETTLAPDHVAVVVTNHETFSEAWPGDRNVVGQIENPQQPETYQFDFKLALLDPFGRSFEQVESHAFPEFGDFLQSFERSDPEASSNESSNWFVASDFNNGPGGGTPGELSFRIIEFSFDPPAARPGDYVTLNWEVSRPATLQIADDIGPLSGTSGSFDLVVPDDARFFRFWLNAQTTFTNRNRLAALELPPSLRSFASSKRAITPGDEITLRWSQATPYIRSQLEISPEVPPGLYGSSHTFTPLVSGFSKGLSWRTHAHETRPGENWHTVDFDVPWRNRRAAIGFGNDHLTTELTPRDWLTAYFRRNFQITEIEEIEELFLDIFNDDGIEIFVNGKKVFRDNLPQGAIDHHTPALTKMAPSERTVGIDPAVLVEGQNIIAVGVHNSAIEDDDLVFDLGLRAKRRIPASGQRTYTFTASNDAGADSASITLLFRESVSVAEWQSDQGLIGDPKGSDSDGDGLTDFLEFVTGSDPWEQSSNPTSISRDQEGFLTITFPHNLLSESNFLNVQSSRDLKTWSNLSDFKFEGSVAPEGSNIAKVSYRSYAPVRETRYFRLITN